jgi:hypothetical protein
MIAARKPNYDSRRLAIHVAHESDLNALLDFRGLIDGDGINPQAAM